MLVFVSDHQLRRRHESHDSELGTAKMFLYTSPKLDEKARKTALLLSYSYSFDPLLFSSLYSLQGTEAGVKDEGKEGHGLGLNYTSKRVMKNKLRSRGILS